MIYLDFASKNHDTFCRRTVYNMPDVITMVKLFCILITGFPSQPI